MSDKVVIDLFPNDLFPCWECNEDGELWCYDCDQCNPDGMYDKSGMRGK